MNSDVPYILLEQMSRVWTTQWSFKDFFYLSRLFLSFPVKYQTNAMFERKEEKRGGTRGFREDKGRTDAESDLEFEE